MTTYNTGNPIGSTDPRDLYDNSENLDFLVNGDQPSYDDRLGNSRKSWAGIEQDFQQFLVDSGYVGTGAGGVYQDYDTDGPLTITALNQIFTKDGEFYRAKASLSLPYTTSGTWVGDDEARFVSVGDAVLRQDLADNTSGSGSDLLAYTGTAETVTEALDRQQEEVNERTIYVGSVAELSGIVDPVDGQVVIVSGDEAGIYEYSASGDTWSKQNASVDPEPIYQAFPVVQRAAEASIYTKQNPPAVYDETSNKTFFVYAGPGRDVWAIAYDHTTHTWSQPEKVDDNPIRSVFGVEDDHGAPAMAIDRNGFIHVLYGSHNTKTYWAKSDFARDISSWTTEELTSISDMTYAGLALDESDGRIYSFFRAGTTHGASYPTHEFGGLMYLEEGGSTWTEVSGGIIDTTGYPGAATDVYPTDIKYNDGKIYVGWTVADGATHNDVRKDTHAAYYDPSDGNMYSVAGVSLGATVTFSERASVLIDEADYSEGPKLAFGAGGRIYAVICKVVSATESGHFVATWDGASWTVSDTGARTNYYFFSGQLRVKEDDTVELFVPVNGDPIDDSSASTASGSEEINNKLGTGIAAYTSDVDAATWTLDKLIARKDQIACQGVRALCVPLNSHPGLKCIFGTAESNKATYLAPIYAVTDENYEPLRVSDMLTLIPKERTIYVNYSGDYFFDETMASGAPAAEFDASEFVNLNAHSIIVEVVLAPGSPSSYPTTWAATFKQAGSTRDRDAIIRVRPQDSTALGDIFEIPLSFDGKFEYQNLGDDLRLRLKLLAYKTI